MDSLSSILKTVGTVAHSLLEPVNLLPTFADPTQRSPSRDDDVYDTDDMWLLQKRRRALCQFQQLSDANASAAKRKKAQSSGASHTGDFKAPGEQLPTPERRTPSEASTAIIDDDDSIGKYEQSEADINNIPNVVRDELIELLGIAQHPMHVGLALLTAGAEEKPALVGSRWGAREKRALLALDQLCSAIEDKRSQLIYWPRPGGPAARATRRAFDALATLRPDAVPPLDGVCGVLLSQHFQQPAVDVHAICDASGTFRWVDVQQRLPMADEPPLQLPPMARDAFVVADEDDGRAARLGVHVMVPVRRAAGHQLSEQERRFNVAVRRRTAIGRWAMRRLVKQFAKLVPLATPAPVATRTTTTTEADDQTDLKRFGIDGHRFVLAAMVVQNLCIKHVPRTGDDEEDEADEESAEYGGIVVKAEPVDGGDDVVVAEPTTEEQNEKGRERRDELIKSM